MKFRETLWPLVIVIAMAAALQFALGCATLCEPGYYELYTTKYRDIPDITIPPKFVVPLPNSPEFNIVSFEAIDIDGKSHKSSEWIGKQPVVLNFWATWCPPCRKEVPHFVKLYEEFKNVEIVSLAVNDHRGRVKKYSENHDISWVLLMSEDKIELVYGIVRGIPTTIFIDKEGREIGRFIGARDYETLKLAFELLVS